MITCLAAPALVHDDACRCLGDRSEGDPPHFPPVQLVPLIPAPRRPR